MTENVYSRFTSAGVDEGFRAKYGMALLDDLSVFIYLQGDTRCDLHGIPAVVQGVAWFNDLRRYLVICFDGSMSAHGPLKYPHVNGSEKALWDIESKAQELWEENQSKTAEVQMDNIINESETIH